LQVPSQAIQDADQVRSRSARVHRASDRFNLELQPHSILVAIRFKIERNIPGRLRQRHLRPIKMNGTQKNRAVAQPEEAMLLLEQLRLRHRLHVSYTKQRLRVSYSEWLQHFMAAQQPEVYIRAGQFGGKLEAGL